MNTTANIRAKLAEALQRITGQAWSVRIDLGDGQPFIADCAAASLQDDLPNAEVDCTIALDSADLGRILAGTMDPRYAILYRRMEVAGSKVVATRFFDRLAGRHVVNLLQTDLPLPRPTTDRARARSDLDAFGYCLIKGALDPVQLEAARRRLVDQATAEKESGVWAHDGALGIDNPPNQRVWNLVNKGQEFIELLEHPLVREFVPAILGEHYLISRFAANIARPGGKPQYLHIDQSGVQPPIDFPVGLNVVWFLDEIREANGGTRILPGSHQPGIAPDNIMSTEGTIAAAGPAGSALIFLSTLWHGTGTNNTQANRHQILSYYVRSWVRPLENAFLSLHPSVLAGFSDSLKALHGFRCTDTVGGVEGSVDGQIVTSDPDKLVLRLEPSKSD